uniref:C1orf55 homolog n=1 Tax=Lepeophtheirus salmonis TaxID=72036 RepID=C1BT95_LEPSM|nr:C1orf55 homolog [Lepeophtheirus salmonis]
MVLLKVQGQCFWRDAQNLADLHKEIIENKDLHFYDWDNCQFYSYGKPLRDVEASFAPNSTVEAVWGLVGGKGGFGSMLRALGAQIEKTTNKDACRDLSGRRLRDINDEEKLKDWIAKQGDREREAAEKKEGKLEKLRRIANGETKHEFHDPDYEKSREETAEKVHEAFAHAIGLKKVELLPKVSSDALKRKSGEKESSGPVAKKRGAVFIGVDISDSDLESSSDEEDDNST